MRPTRLILPVAVIIGIVILSDEILFGSEKILLQNAKVPEDAKVSNAKKEQSLQNDEWSFNPESEFPPQSKTLEEAVAKYLLIRGKMPPQNYDKWFHTAQNKKCLIDEYDQIYEDLTPFYQLSTADFNKRSNSLFENLHRLTDLQVENGKIIKQENGRGSGGGYHGMLINAIGSVPRLKAVFNDMDENRVLFNEHMNITLEEETSIDSDKVDWHHLDRGKHEAFMDAQCQVHNPNRPLEHMNELHGLIIEPDSSEYLMHLYPVLSTSKISECFSDILVPQMSFYPQNPPNESKLVSWENRTPKLYWRGSATGGRVMNGNYRRFQRHRLIKVAEGHEDILDVQFTAYPQCEPKDCEESKKEYGVGKWTAWEDHYKYKYVLDIDGNGWSGRFFQQLMSGAVVFKSTMLTEFWTKWLVPYKHYVPVSIDLRDIEMKARWMANNDEAAKQIMMNGKAFAKHFFRNEQLECYMELLLLELSRLSTGNDYKKQ